MVDLSHLSEGDESSLMGSPTSLVPHNLSPLLSINEDPVPLSSELPDDATFGTEHQHTSFTQMLLPGLDRETPHMDESGLPVDQEFYVYHTPNGTKMWCPHAPTGF